MSGNEPRSDSREAVHRIVERIGLDSLTDGVIASFAAGSDFETLFPSDEALTGWVRWNIELTMRWLLADTPPTADELERLREVARISAAAGAAPDTVPANYRLGARFAWGALLQRARDGERVALVDCAGPLLEFVDRASVVIAEAYDAAARTSAAFGDERAAEALLGRLLGSVDLPPEDREFARRIGFNLSGPFRPFVLTAHACSSSQHRGFARRLRAGRALAACEGRLVSGLAHQPLAWRELGAGPTLVIAEGDPTPRNELGAALRDMRTLVEIVAARGNAGVVALDDYLPHLLLRHSPGLSRRLHARIYAPLDNDLARTLDSLVEHNFDRGRAAAALPVHRNTLANRIRRIRALTGVDLDRAGEQTLVWLAWLQHTQLGLEA